MSTALTSKQKAERDELALLSSYEIDSIGRHLKENLPAGPEYLYLRCMVLRVIELSSVVMSVMGGDDTRKTEEMRSVVEGDA